MGYKHIDNLYKNKEILMFKEVYALEKIHGTSAHISWKNNSLNFFSGGAEYLHFVKIFDHDFLNQKFTELNINDITIYGEAYGGKMQGMRDTYGKELKFVAFEVKKGEHWLSVPNAEGFCKSINIDFVPYVKCTTEIETLDKYKNEPSIQSQKCGIEGPKEREGIVLRPLIEVYKSNGERITAKYKNDNFKETKTSRVISEEEIKILEEADEIANEWVTEMRLSHVLDKIPNANIENTKEVIAAMVEDVERESEGEIVKSKLAKKAIGKRAAKLFQEKLKSSLYK